MQRDFGIEILVAIAVYMTSMSKPALSQQGYAMHIDDMPIEGVTEYGAICSGVTNDSAAIAKAIQAASPGSCVLFPHGTYLNRNDFRRVQCLLSSQTAQQSKHTTTSPSTITSQLTNVTNTGIVGKIYLER
jgi:hypothetical protein